MLRIAKLTEDATIPTRKHPNDAGVDLYSSVDIIIHPHSSRVVNTGITMDLTFRNKYPNIPTTVAFVGLVWPKSRNDHLIGGGVVDQDYQGEILVKVFNTSNEDYVIRKGDAIAQLIIQNVVVPEVIEVSKDEVHPSKTARGESGGIVEQISLFGEDVEDWDTYDEN